MIYIESIHGSQDGIRFGTLRIDGHRRRFHFDRLTGSVRLFTFDERTGERVPVETGEDLSRARKLLQAAA